MNPLVTGSAVTSESQYPAADLVAFFKARSVLVIAAVRALEPMSEILVSLASMIDAGDWDNVSRQRQTLEDLVTSATVDGDNLLLARPGFKTNPFVLCSVGRLPSGVIDVRTTELDRDTLALTGEPGKHARSLDGLASGVEVLLKTPDGPTIDAALSAIDAMSAQVRGALSRLSIVKARLDLQESFLAGIVDEDVASAPVQLESHLDHSGARDMALEARRLLSAGSLKIARGNRQTVTSLFEPYMGQQV